MGSSAKASLPAIDLLKAACRSTAESFASQIREVLPQIAEPDRPRVQQMANNFAVFGYALLGEDGELLRLENVRGLNARADVGMHQHAHIGWSSFLPLHVPERAPQMRAETLLGEDRSYLEGMQIANSAFLGITFDYWRMYEDGVCCFAESYREDYQGRSDRIGVPLALVKLHSILAHARLVGQEMPTVAKVAIHMEWIGLAGRYLMWDRHDAVGPMHLTDDRLIKTVTLVWAELRDDYFEALRKISLPFFNLWDDPTPWFTRERVEQMFASLHAQLRLF